MKEELIKIHKAHSKVFDGDLRQGYNGYSGNFQVDFNFLNDVPPPINYGCVPSYNKREDDVLLQTMIDRLEKLNAAVEERKRLGKLTKPHHSPLHPSHQHVV